ncbi:MAG: enolase C-terminal domain-like protein [Acidobacteriota bacterium]
MNDSPRDQSLTLRSIELRVVVLPQHEVFRSAVGERHHRRALLVLWHDANGAVGVGECSCRPDPFYSGEFVDGAQIVLERFAQPLIAAAGSRGELNLGAVEKALGRIRGWPFTTAAVLDAACDLLRRIGGRDYLDGLAVREPRVPVGISLGLFPDTESAVRRLGEEVEQGYRRIKLKIQPGLKLDHLRAIRRRFPDLCLGFDANGSFGEDGLDFLVALAELEPAMLEQPFGPDRWDLLTELRRRSPELPLCLDESIHGLGSLRLALEIGVIDELNLKPGRVGGPAVTAALLDESRRRGLPVWIGGMFETSIGRRANLRVAARVEGATAHDLSPSSRYFTRDLVVPPVAMDADGRIELDEAPVELDRASLDELTVERRIVP